MVKQPRFAVKILYKNGTSAEVKNLDQFMLVRDEEGQPEGQAILASHQGHIHRFTKSWVCENVKTVYIYQLLGSAGGKRQEYILTVSKSVFPMDDEINGHPVYNLAGCHYNTAAPRILDDVFEFTQKDADFRNDRLMDLFRFFTA